MDLHQVAYMMLRRGMECARTVQEIQLEIIAMNASQASTEIQPINVLVSCNLSE